MTEPLNPDDLRDLYQDLILDHGKHPHNLRAIENPSCEAVGHNPLCGDKVVLYLTIGPDNLIADAAFQGSGCAISMASASMMTDILIGKTAEAAKNLLQYFGALCMGENDIVETLRPTIGEDDLDRLDALSGVRNFPMRVKCATLAWRTLELALTPEADRPQDS